MKKYILILTTTLTLFACTNTNTKSESNESSLNYIDSERDIYFKNDSLTLHPFEQFNIVKFERIDNESALSLKFNVIDTIQIIKASADKKNTRVIDQSIYIFDNNIKYDNVSATIKLKTVNGYIDRKTEIGKEYKMIYCYFSDSEFHRIDPASDDYNDGYYIVDIVPLNERFERESTNTNEMTTNTTEENISSSNSSEAILRDEVNQKITNKYFYNDENGLYTVIHFEPVNEGAPLGSMVLSQLKCDYAFSYEIIGNKIVTTFVKSGCGKTSFDRTFYYDGENGNLIFNIGAEAFVFTEKP